jgi:hypothetical protein
LPIAYRPFDRGFKSVSSQAANSRNPAIARAFHSWNSVTSFLSWPAASVAQTATGPSKKPSDPLRHADCQVGEHASGFLDVFSGGLEYGRNLLETRDDCAKPFARRGEIALDQQIDGAARQPGVTHRVACPLAEHIQVDQLGLDLPLQKDQVDFVIIGQLGLLRSHITFERGEPSLELRQFLDPADHARF